MMDEDNEYQSGIGGCDNEATAAKPPAADRGDRELSEDNEKGSHPDTITGSDDDSECQNEQEEKKDELQATANKTQASESPSKTSIASADTKQRIPISSVGEDGKPGAFSISAATTLPSTGNDGKHQEQQLRLAPSHDSDEVEEETTSSLMMTNGLTNLKANNVSSKMNNSSTACNGDADDDDDHDNGDNNVQSTRQAATAIPSTTMLTATTTLPPDVRDIVDKRSLSSPSSEVGLVVQRASSGLNNEIDRNDNANNAETIVVDGDSSNNGDSRDDDDDDDDGRNSAINYSDDSSSFYTLGNGTAVQSIVSVATVASALNEEDVEKDQQRMQELEHQVQQLRSEAVQAQVISRQDSRNQNYYYMDNHERGHRLSQLDNLIVVEGVENDDEEGGSRGLTIPNGGSSNKNKTDSDGTKWYKRGIVIILIIALTLVVIVCAVVFGIAGSDNDTSLSSSTADTMIPTSSPTSPPLSSLRPTLSRIKERGHIVCRGFDEDIFNGYGFSYELCKAIGAAIFNDTVSTTTYEVKLLPFKESFLAINNGTCDISTSQTTPTLQRDIREATTQRGFMFTQPYFYSGTTFVGIPGYVECAENGDTLTGICRDLSVCVLQGSVFETLLSQNLDGSAIYGVAFTDALFEGLVNGDCNVITGGPLFIHEQRIRDAGYVGEVQYASRFFDRDPLALTSRGDDIEFGDFINWILKSLIVAEAMNTTKENYYKFPTTNLFGPEYTHMFQNAIAAAGNYGDVYNISWQTKVPRRPGGINTLHTSSDNGGLLYANPLGNLNPLELEDEEYPLMNSTTIDGIGDKQELRCGIVLSYTDDISAIHHPVPPGLVHWNDTLQEYMGISVDYCRGLAAALFTSGSASDTSLVMIPFSTMNDGFVALGNGTIDVLSGAVYTMENDIYHPATKQGYSFSDIFYYHSLNNATSGTNGGGGDSNQEVVLPLAMATREHDVQWSDLVKAISMCPIHAELSGINQTTAVEMPTIQLFGLEYRQSFRDVILKVGNYNEIYQRNMQHYVPRSENPRNNLNTGGNPMLFTYWKF